VSSRQNDISERKAGGQQEEKEEVSVISWQ